MSAPVLNQDKLTLRDVRFASSPFNTIPIGMGVGDWNTPSPDRLNDWLERQLLRLDEDQRGRRVHIHSVISDFRRLIETDPEIYMGFHRMFENVPDKDPVGRPQVKDYDKMLRLFNRFLNEAPEFDQDFLVFLPFTAVLQWPMSMANGFTILINRQVNDHFRRMFGVWSEFLASSESQYVLTDREDGWLGPKAMQNMPDFVKTFICDPSAPHWGFESWDHFFARILRDGARPVWAPDDSSVITSACESKVLRITSGVREVDQFWLKGQPYSLRHMLNNDSNVHSFIGGTVYQAFLSPFYYHRWSSPVTGTVVKTEVVQGTYFAGIPTDGVIPGEEALQGNQAFITHIASRALIFIQADDARIGLMCFIGVGMVEVSSCEITVEKGQRVNKGQEIGTFHFGGSTHCLVFRPDTKLDWLVKDSENGEDGDFVKVHTPIAQLK